jgi:hypothetical protein
LAASPPSADVDEGANAARGSNGKGSEEEPEGEGDHFGRWSALEQSQGAGGEPAAVELAIEGIDEEFAEEDDGGDDADDGEGRGGEEGGEEEPDQTGAEAEEAEPQGMRGGWNFGGGGGGGGGGGAPQQTSTPAHKRQSTATQGLLDFQNMHHGESLGVRGVTVGSDMMTRGVLGVVAVTLLWCTSFALLDAQVVKYVKTPAQGAIRTQCDAAISYTKESRADYEKCVNVQVDKCDATYVARLTDTAKTSFDAQKHNVLVLNDLTANVGTCTNTLTLALQLIDEWVAPAGQTDRQYQANKDALNAFGYNSHLGATCAGISGTIGHSADSAADSQVAVAGQREAVYELAYQVCE